MEGANENHVQAVRIGTRCDTLPLRSHSLNGMEQRPHACRAMGSTTRAEIKSISWRTDFTRDPLPRSPNTSFVMSRYSWITVAKNLLPKTTQLTIWTCSRVAGQSFKEVIEGGTSPHGLSTAIGPPVAL